ncbi:MAG: transcriptional regulator GcvA [Sphingomonadales bacterium]|nr:transcriptional regulator GcvA [Sphingomonadales bacterium]
MKRALLPLNALRAFDAAARHLSFKNAAEELAVTPAAVSQQIRSLEDYLGVTLFKRAKGTLILTREAKNSLAKLQDGFKRFEETVQILQAVQEDKTLSISVSPSFASKWLVPRLGRYYQEQADVVVKISASMQLVNFDTEDFDLAIRYGGGKYNGLYSEKFIQEEVFPVCSPDLLNGDGAIASLDDLRSQVLIHDDSSVEDESCPTWPMWLKAAGVGVDEGQRGLHFNQSNLAIEAAIAGRGVALAKRTLAEADLAAGRLAQPFCQSQPVDFAYYIVCPEEKLELDKVTDFIAWLRNEAGRNSLETETV